MITIIFYMSYYTDFDISLIWINNQSSMVHYSEIILVCIQARRSSHRRWGIVMTRILGCVCWISIWIMAEPTSACASHLILVILILLKWSCFYHVHSCTWIAIWTLLFPFDNLRKLGWMLMGATAHDPVISIFVMVMSRCCSFSQKRILKLTAIMHYCLWMFLLI